MAKPTIRFNGYTEDWEQRKLDDVVEFLDTMRKPLEGAKRISGSYPYYGASGIVDYVDGYLFDEELILLSEDGANITDRNYPVCFLASGKYWVNNHAHVLRTKKENENNFICNSLERKDYTQYNTGMAMPKLNKETCRKIPILCPAFEEQQKIGDYFRSLDHLITLHQRISLYFLKINTFVWEQRKFGELVTIERGGSPRPIDKFITNDENGLNWVKIGDAPEHGNYITQTKEKIRPEGLSKTREVHPGDLVLSNSMSFGRPYIMAIDGCIHDGWLAIRDTKKNFELKFLCTLLGTDGMLNQYKAMAAGSTVNNLNKELVGGTTVEFPMMEEQIKIGDYFTTIDHLITLHQRKPYFWNKFIVIDWEQRKLSEFVDKAVDNRGKTPPLDENGTHPLIEVAALGGVHPNYSKVDKYLSDDSFENNLRAYIKKGDILFTTVGSIGLVSLMDSREEAAIAQNIVAFRAKENFIPEYLYALFSNEENQYKANRIVMGAVQPSIKVSQLVDVEYMLTRNVKEQKKIGSFFSNIDNLITLHQRKCGELKNIKKFMLQNMFV